MLTAVNAALEKKAEALIALDLRDLVSFADFFVICSGNSRKQVQAIADGVTDALKASGLRPRQVEGYARAEWVLIDYGGLIVHVFGVEARSFYDLERLWRDAKPLALKNASAPTRKVAAPVRKKRQA